MLQASLGKGWLVGNFGHSGRTALAGRSAFDTTAAYRAARCFEPHIVVLMLGSNDAKPALWGPSQRFPHAEFGSALLTLARSLLDVPSHPSLLLLVPPPALPVDPWERGVAGLPYPLGSVGWSNLDKHAINTALAPVVLDAAESLARDTRASSPADGARHVRALDLQPAFGGCENVSLCCELLVRDGVHPSTHGAALIAREVHRALSWWFPGP